MMRRALPWAALLPVTAQAAAQAAENPAPASSLFQLLFGLIAVLGLMGGAAWLLKRLGVARSIAGAPLKVVGGISVGGRERILVVEVADQWIVVGVAPGRVNTLSTMPRQEAQASVSATPDPANFSSWLKQTIEKRNGNR
ncbi:MAG TPA: flagellar biosynthetic protein FliO [Noviherbaspirillum sp.]|jgi:flagellar protein FliO/FliZ|uniref:flagellar biosynthetic protein FliO n=1 Tax=Noviherbaspirillum sp. TaxID=1926288 RepID=UPI002DDCB77B|nr:flagellar biosynthetic protein FliO [Noviherbaspirillum sp.]HEV2609771.1 flagellar biosynthetic protein FliO [Noviherbaspirillum sp.]